MVGKAHKSLNALRTGKFTVAFSIRSYSDGLPDDGIALFGDYSLVQRDFEKIATPVPKSEKGAVRRYMRNFRR